MKLIKTTVALSLVASLIAFTACDKNQLLTNADIVLSSFKAARPLIASALPGAVGLIDKGLEKAEPLRAAVAASDAATAAGLLNDLIPIFNQIVEEEVSQIKDANKRTLIMAALAGGDIGLHFLVRHFLKSAPPSMTTGRAANALRAFDRKEQWGHRYKK